MSEETSKRITSADELSARMWREVARHASLADLLPTLTDLLASALPVDEIVLRRFDAESGRLLSSAAAVVGASNAHEPAHVRTDLTDDEAERVVEFILGDGIAVVASARDELRRLLLPPAFHDPAIVVGLVHEARPVGVAIARLVDSARSQFRLDESTRGLFAASAEPLAEALANDTREHEQVRLREALEADKQALLSRLQRVEIADSIVGESSGLREVMERVEQVAATDAPVLILGETGSGKEVIARAIHARSRRSAGPVVRVNCGAIPSELIDSELFGHERGSFTGAVRARQGWFERADGGTLFLDEIGELPQAAQVRMLRVLQDGSLERVGGHHVISVDVRIVAATHRNLDDMVARGEFREDLWYRISVFPVRLPALRERREDIEALAKHFAAKAGLRLGGSPLFPENDDVELLRTYDWPGNVRELAAVIERAVILGNGKRLEVAKALGVAGTPGRTRIATDAGTTTELSNLESSEMTTLDAAITLHIERALRATRGRIEGPFGAAKLLAVNPHTLRARMRKLGIRWESFRAE